MAKVCKAIYPGPTNQKALSHNGCRYLEQRYIHGAFKRGYCRIFSNEQTVTIAFRGTREKVDWLISNLRCWPEWLRHCDANANWVTVHRGFQRTLEYSDKSTRLRSIDATMSALEDMKLGNRDLFITGHSLGAACATGKQPFSVRFRGRKTIELLEVLGQPAASPQP
ncbi:lipase family protein [Allomesorhizobium alhagi]|uniref:lipase family protein n=1 Tax=Allomesorhizobium alhagi TaxID=475067 RepID=UPI001112127B